MKHIADLINKATTPIIYAGHGCTLYRDYFMTLIDDLQIPVMYTWRAVDLLPYDHPLNAGQPGLFESMGANDKLDKADLVIILAARMDDNATCYDINLFAPNAFKIVVDIDKAELDRLPDDWIKVNQDVGEFMKELYEVME